MRSVPACEEPRPRALHRGLHRRALLALLTLPVAAAPRAQTPEMQPPNPHWRADQCHQCHGVEGPAPMTPAEADALCAECHDPQSVARVIHPLGMPPGRLARRMAATEVPLVDGAVGCLSCHDLLVQCLGDAEAHSRNRPFLRGPSEGDVVASCYQCHEPEPFNRHDPHVQRLPDGSLDAEKCRLCHGEEMDVAGVWTDPVPLRAPEATLCGNCHRVIPHPSGVNHLVMPNRVVRRQVVQADLGPGLAGLTPRQVERLLQRQTTTEEVSLPLAEILPLGPSGAITCTTCHEPHESGAIPQAATALQGPRLRMPSEDLCRTCHPM